MIQSKSIPSIKESASEYSKTYADMNGVRWISECSYKAGSKFALNILDIILDYEEDINENSNECISLIKRLKNVIKGLQEE